VTQEVRGPVDPEVLRAEACLADARVPEPVARQAEAYAGRPGDKEVHVRVADHERLGGRRAGPREEPPQPGGLRLAPPMV